jgi:hypothetical protein
MIQLIETRLSIRDVTMSNVYLRALVLATITAVSVGCGGGSGGNSAATSNDNPTSTPTPTPAPNSGFPAAFDVGLSYSRDLYVNAAAAPGGNGSPGAPFNTIGAALGQATPGTRIRIAAGTYGAIGSFSNLQGTAQAPIALVGEGAVIVDTAQAAQALHLSDPRYVVIQGITVQNTAPHGINIDDGGDYSTPAQYVVLRNMTFRNIGTGGNNDCLKLSGVDRFYIEGSAFSGCNQGEAIDMVGCHDGVITGNRFFDLPMNGVQTKGGSADVLIHGNRFTNISQRSINAGGSTGAPYYRPLNTTHEAARIQMVANLFERTGSAPVAFVGCDTCVFANNTIIEPGTYLARILEENTALTAGANGYFINNIIVLNTSGRGSVVNVGAGTQPATYTFGSNLWYSLDNAGYTGPTYGGGVPAETGAIIQQDPRLDSGRRPQPGSPAIGAGRSVPRGLVGDFDRALYTTPPTLGAFAGP